MILRIERGELSPVVVIHNGVRMTHLAASCIWKGGEPTLLLVLDLEQGAAVLPGDTVCLGDQVWTCRSRIADDEYGAGPPSLSLDLVRNDLPAPRARPIAATDVVTAYWQLRCNWSYVLGKDVNLYLDVCGAEAIAILVGRVEDCFGLKWDGTNWRPTLSAIAVTAQGMRITSREILRAAAEHPSLGARTKAEALSRLL